MRIEFRILGPLEVSVDGRVLPLGSPKQRALLALMLIRANETLSRDRLIEELWADAAPASVESAFHVYLSRLRRLLDSAGGNGLLVRQAHGYRLRVEPDQLDATRFQRLVGEGREALAAGEAERAAERLRRALALWRGPALADLESERFAIAAAARLEEERVAALEQRLEADLALGRNRELVGELETLVAEHPYRERLRAQLMLALYRSRRQAEALRAYQQARRTLADELGLEPGSELRELEQAILRQDPTLTLDPNRDLKDLENAIPTHDAGLPARPAARLGETKLPIQPTSFLGRERELTEVLALLHREDVRVLTLTGTGGSGKTRLALQAAAEASESYADGVFWVPLAPLRDPTLVLSSVAQALEIREEPGRELVETIGSRLAGKRPLVLLDNAEHLLPRLAVDVAGLVAACPTLTLVVTSRERFQIAAEAAWPVPTLTPSDAERLFVERARSAGVSLIVDETVAELCRRLDKLPLALELAAARTVVFSPGQLLERSSQRLDLLKGGRDADPRQQTVRETIAWSHDLLNAGEQALFRRMSVFDGSCTFESAEEVAGANPDVLQSLLDKSLLQRRDSGGRPRFGMLETIREFATEQLAAAGEADDLERRHLEHYAALAEACFDETLQGNDDLDRFEDERENLRLALDVALRTNPELALELARRLSLSWMQRGEFREGRERLAAALDRADAPTPARAWALHAAAGLALRQGDDAVTGSLASEALARFRELGDQRGAGCALHVLGRHAMGRAEWGEAKRLFEEAADALSGPGDEQLQRTATEALANVVGYQGDHTRATKLLRDFVARARREGSNANLAKALINLGVMEGLAGETEQARRSLEEGVALIRQGANKLNLAIALYDLAYVMQATAPEDALAHYSESLRLRREMEQPGGIAACLEGGAAIFTARGNPAHAATLLGAASAIRTQADVLLLDPDEQAEVATIEAHCRRALSAEAFTRAWQDGAALDAPAATEWALQFWEKAE